MNRMSKCVCDCVSIFLSVDQRDLILLHFVSEFTNFTTMFGASKLLYHHPLHPYARSCHTM
jgi:hypothetical protein